MQVYCVNWTALFNKLSLRKPGLMKCMTTLCCHVTHLVRKRDLHFFWLKVLALLHFLLFLRDSFELENHSLLKLLSIIGLPTSHFMSQSEHSHWKTGPRLSVRQNSVGNYEWRWQLHLKQNQAVFFFFPWLLSRWKLLFPAYIPSVSGKWLNVFAT